MSRFSIQFIWPKGQDSEPGGAVELSATTFDSAKMQAAMQFAISEFERPPTGYRILQNDETEVYRFPETANDVG